MDSNDRSDRNEMEQIQRGLEAFLEKEMDGARVSGNRRGGRREEAVEDSEEIRIIGQPRGRGQSRRQWEAAEPYPGDWQDEDEEPFRGGMPPEDEAYDEEPDLEDWDNWEEEARPARRRRAEYGGYGDEEPYPGDWRDEEEEIPRRRAEYGRYEEEPRRRRGEYGGYEEEPRRRRGEYGGYEEEPRRGKPGYDTYEDEPPRRQRAEYETYEDEEPRRRRRQTVDAAPPRKRGRDYEEEEASRGKRYSRKKGNSKEKELEPEEEDSRMSKKASKAQKKRRKRKSRLRRFLIAVAVIVALLGFGLYQLVGVVYSKMNYKELSAEATGPMKEDGVVNILLIGNDSRENGEDGRSDAMILISISSRTKTIYMTSLLRDIYVEIPGHDGNRLNAAYAFGGPELLMATIEQNFGIPVNRYMLVNFEAFAGLVDAVGGIELELTRDEIDYVNGYLVEYNMLTGREQGTDNMDLSVADNGPAVVHLNGPQALAYSRNRYLGTDFGRTERQRKVLTAVIGKLPLAMLTNAGGLMDGLMPNLTTNLTQAECFSLSLTAGKLLTYDIVSDNIPQPGTYRDVTIREMAVLEVDFDANIKYLKEKIYGE